MFVARRLAQNGLVAFSIAQKKGFEGIVAKDNSAPYEEGRSRKWLKVKAHREEEFVIGGFTPRRGSRKHFGALLLGAYHGPDLNYVGKVGTGFSEQTLAYAGTEIQAADSQKSALRRSAERGGDVA